MKLLRRAPADPAVIAAQAAAQQAAVHAQIEQARLQAQLDRELREAAAEEARLQAAADEADRRRRDDARGVEREAARDRRRKSRAEFAAKARPVLPLLLINGGAAYAQAAYAYDDIAPADWDTPSKVLFAIAFATALESIAVYVQWHAHDALMLKAHATAAALRRASWVIAGIVGAINYAHFADGMKPTAAAIAFALLSLLSPWLWGLHTRRAQHVQLLAEDANLIDEGGVEFSPQRRRAFPLRAWQAKRWSIDHYERDPRKAWEGYNAERATRKAEQVAAKVKQAEPDDVEAPPEVDPVNPWDYAEPAGPAPDRELVAPRPRWRPTAGRRPRRLAAPRAPEVTVVVEQPATHAATRPATRWHSPTTLRPRQLRAVVSRRMSQTPAPAGDTTDDTTGRRLSRPKPPAKRQSTAERVAAAVARKPDIKADILASRLGVSPRTVQRHMNKQTVAVNGHNHTQEQ